MNYDLINAGFEFIGAGCAAYNLALLLKHKEVKGISLLSSSFFSCWGWWNCLYYPSLDQWFSFAGAIALAGFNTVWLFMAIYYRNR